MCKKIIYKKNNTFNILLKTHYHTLKMVLTRSKCKRDKIQELLSLVSELAASECCVDRVGTQLDDRALVLHGAKCSQRDRKSTACLKREHAGGISLQTTLKRSHDKFKTAVIQERGETFRFLIGSSSLVYFVLVLLFVFYFLKYAQTVLLYFMLAGFLFLLLTFVSNWYFESKILLIFAFCLLVFYFVISIWALLCMSETDYCKITVRNTNDWSISFRSLF